MIISDKNENPLFSVYDPLSVKLLMCLRLEFSHGNEHRFWHVFKDTLNPVCTCVAEVETTEHFFVHCQLYSTHRSELFDKIVKIDQQILNLTARDQLVLLYVSQRNNSENLNHNQFFIKYRKSTGHFDRSRFNANQ